MAQTLAVRPNRPRRGFSFVEISVVVIVVGALAAFGVPRLMQSVERSKAAEAFKYLASVTEAQEEYLANHGTFAADLTDLGIKAKPPIYFSVGSNHPGHTGKFVDSWTLTLTRAGSSSGYGAYSVTFTEDGFDTGGSTIDSEINPQPR